MPAAAGEAPQQGAAQPRTFLRQGPQLQHDTQPAPHVPLHMGHTHAPLEAAASQSSPCRLRRHLLLCGRGGRALGVVSRELVADGVPD